MMIEWSRLCLGSGPSSVERPKTSHSRVYFGTSAEARRENKLKARHEGFVKEQPELFGQLVKNLSSTHFEKTPDFFLRDSSLDWLQDRFIGKVSNVKM